MKKNKIQENIEIIRALPEHADVILAFLYPYFLESTYRGLTFSKENSRNMIMSWIEQIGLIALADNKIAGFASIEFAKTFYEEIEADIQMFYISPTFRGSGVSRALVKEVIRQTDHNKAAVTYTSCFSGINHENNQLYVNLWKKDGFKVLGTTLYRGGN